MKLVTDGPLIARRGLGFLRTPRGSNSIYETGVDFEQGTLPAALRELEKAFGPLRIHKVLFPKPIFGTTLSGKPSLTGFQAYWDVIVIPLRAPKDRVAMEFDPFEGQLQLLVVTGLGFNRECVHPQVMPTRSIAPFTAFGCPELLWQSPTFHLPSATSVEDTHWLVVIRDRPLS
jgi:hypothetical protein